MAEFGPQAPLLNIVIKAEGLDKIVGDLSAGLFAIHDLQRVIDKYLEIIRAQAVYNVSGNQVTYSGGTFVVNRVTGKLSQSMQTYRGGPLVGYVVDTANYASAVHDGHGPIDMKKFLPVGTVVPIKSTKAAFGKGGNGVAKKAKKSASGKITGYEYIAFRRVGKKGWIIPAAAARPFLTAAAEKWEPDFAKEIADVVAGYIVGDNNS